MKCPFYSGGGKLNNLKFVEWVALNSVAILFILGLIFVNVAIYLLFNLAIGLLATGITLIVVALILAYERGWS